MRTIKIQSWSQIIETYYIVDILTVPRTDYFLNYLQFASKTHTVINKTTHRVPRLPVIICQAVDPWCNTKGNRNNDGFIISHKPSNMKFKSIMFHSQRAIIHFPILVWVLWYSDFLHFSFFLTSILSDPV